jgi:hypothetical protein
MQTSKTVRLLAITALAGCATAPPSAGPANVARLGVMPDYVLAADSIVFTEADADRDRRTTTPELAQWAQTQWTLLARDGAAIGVVRFGEWSQSLFGPIDVASQFGHLTFDRNMDGQITREEFATELQRRMTFRDENANGVLERVELWVRLPRMPSGPPRGMAPGGMPPGGPPGGGRPPGM